MVLFTCYVEVVVICMEMNVVMLHLHLPFCTMLVLDRPAELRKIYNLPLQDWQVVGLELDIPQNALKIISKDNPGDFNVQKHEMFNTWLCQGAHATYRKLIEVLRRIEDNESVTKLGQNLG